jgi:hypothetical protein
VEDKTPDPRNRRDPSSASPSSPSSSSPSSEFGGETAKRIRAAQRYSDKFILSLAYENETTTLSPPLFTVPEPRGLTYQEQATHSFPVRALSLCIQECHLEAVVEAEAVEEAATAVVASNLSRGSEPEQQQQHQFQVCVCFFYDGGVVKLPSPPGQYPHRFSPARATHFSATRYAQRDRDDLFPLS